MKNYIGFGTFDAFVNALPQNASVNIEHISNPPQGRIKSPAFTMPLYVVCSANGDGEMLYCYMKVAGYFVVSATLEAFDDAKRREAATLAETAYDLTVYALRDAGHDVREGAMLAMPRSLRLIEAMPTHLWYNKERCLWIPAAEAPHD